MTQIAVLFCGTIGLTLVLRAALFYRATDPFSYSLALLIAAGLLVGVAEVFYRALRSDRLLRELRTVGPSPQAVETSSPNLRALLHLRLGGNGTQVSTAVFTPYLLGLLVMLGMLGTFMGLFESLRGAREALTSSGDVDALRSGLASPMQGLSRAFGLSAAGVSASAALGLAAVFVRRSEARVSNAITALVTGPLASLTSAGRQLAALEALAAHAPGWSAAASSLRDATSEMRSTRLELIDAQNAARAEAAQAIRDVSQAVRLDVREGIDVAIKRVGATVEPLIDGLLRQAGEVAGQHLERLSHRMDKESEARESFFVQHLDALRQIVESAATGLAKDVAARAAHMDEHLETWVRGVEVPLRALVDLQQEHAQSVQQQLRALVEEMRERLADVASRNAEHVQNLVTEQVRSLDDLGQEQRAFMSRATDMDSARAEVLHEKLLSITDALRKQVESSLEAHAIAMTALETRNDVLTATVAGRLDAMLEALQVASVRMGEREQVHLDVLGDVAERVRTDIERSLHEQQGRLDAAVRPMADVIQALRKSAEDSALRLNVHARELLDAIKSHQKQLHEDLAARAAQASDRIDDLDRVLVSHLRELGAGLKDPLEDVVRSVQTAPMAAAKLVDEARERLEIRARSEVARDEHLDKLIGNLAQLGATLQASTSSQAAQLQQLADQAERHVAESQARTEASLNALLEHVHGAMDQQAERLEHYEQRLDASRNESLTQILERFGAHAQGLSDSMSATGVLVQEASTLVRAGGAEMSAVAEMFATAVDRYRDASDRLLTNLGPIEDAVERAGQGETADLLGAYLDQTREVFDSSLQFQRELFSELRALRGQRDAADA